MSSIPAPLAPSPLPAPAATDPVGTMAFEPILDPLTGKWPQHRAALLAAAPGFALIGSSAGNWLLVPCGPGTDILEIEGRIERYMVQRMALVTAAPALTIDQAAAARRIAYRTLSGPCALPLLGPCPAGAAVEPMDYAALHVMVGTALCRLQQQAFLPAGLSPEHLEAGALAVPDPAAATAMAAYNPLASSPVRLLGHLQVRVVEVVGGYILMPGSSIDRMADGSPRRASRLLEESHAGLLVPDGPGRYRLQHPAAFASLDAIAGYCLGERRARRARWHWMTERV